MPFLAAIPAFLGTTAGAASADYSKSRLEQGLASRGFGSSGLVLLLLLILTCISARADTILWTAGLETGDLSELACDPSCHGSMSSSATEAHTGSRSLRIANIPGNPNDEYVNGITASHAKLTFWVWTDSTPASSRTVVAWRDTSDNLLLEFVVGSAGGFAVVTSCEAEPQVVGVFAWTVETWTSVEIIFNDDTGFLSVDIGGSGPATRETGCTTQVENLAVVEDTAGTPVFFMDDFELTAIEAATVRPPIMRTQ